MVMSDGDAGYEKMPACSMMLMKFLMMILMATMPAMDDSRWW
jgi:hypothetical protein